VEVLFTPVIIFCTKFRFSSSLAKNLTIDRIPVVGDRLVAKYPPTKDNTNTEETLKYIHASSGIRNHDPSVPANDDNTLLGLCAQYERRHIFM
jgi:hypothetical protein